MSVQSHELQLRRVKLQLESKINPATDEKDMTFPSMKSNYKLV